MRLTACGGWTCTAIWSGSTPPFEAAETALTKEWGFLNSGPYGERIRADCGSWASFALIGESQCKARMPDLAKALASRYVRL